MKKLSKILVFCTVILSPVLETTTRGANGSRLDVKILENGRVAASLAIPNPSASGSTFGFTEFFVGLPFPDLPEQNIICAPDILVKPVSRGPGYTVLLVCTPNNKSIVRIDINNAILLSETREGKAKFSLDCHFGFRSQQAKHLLSLSESIQYWSLRIFLPDDYENTELSYEPKSMKRLDNRTFTISNTDPNSLASGSVWVVFPNPMKGSLLKAQLVLFLLLGALSTIVHANALRNRRLKWLVYTLVVSVCIIAATSYYALVLVKRLEFLVAVAASIPHAIFSFVGGGYIFFSFARAKQP